MSTSATDVSIQAVSPPLGVQFVSTAGTAATAANLSVSATAALAAAQAGVAGGGGFAAAAAGAGAAGAASAGAAGAAGAAAAGASVVAGAVVCATAAAGDRPMKTAAASAGARRESLSVRFIVQDSDLEWKPCAIGQSASLSFSPVRIRTAESRP